MSDWPAESTQDASWRSSVDRALGELMGALDGLRHSVTVLSGAVALTAAVMLAGFAFLGFLLARLDSRLDQVNGKIDALPQRLSDEFRAMRAEMAAQTSAIANAITAAKQQAPQVILVPAPPQHSAPEAPKPEQKLPE